MIYLDNAATTFLKPHSVKEALLNFLDIGANAGRSGHTMSIDAGRVVFNARSKIANLIKQKTR